MTKLRQPRKLLPVLLLVGAVAPAQTTYQETVLHSFAPSLAPNGSAPYAGVIRDANGNLYGTTESGGTWGMGTVYKIDTAGSETVLYNFTGGADGASPEGGLIRDSAGNFYGTTTNGGNGNDCPLPATGCGVVYKLDPSENETVLYRFTGGADGQYPIGVVRDAAGNLYGATTFGGASGNGVVFKLDTAGQETVLHQFNEADGAYPEAGVVLGSDYLYGSTATGGTLPNGGISSWGVVYKLDMAGNETVLYTFTGGADGSTPNALILDSAGNLYGTAQFGGTGQPQNGGDGVVFKLDAAGHETVLWNFKGGLDGARPIAGLLRDSAGSLYGTTVCGGPGAPQYGYDCASGAGVVFKVDPAGQESVLYGFSGGADGAQPTAAVTADSAGNLYGTAGVVYKLDMAGQETVLYRFLARADAQHPAAAPYSDSVGNLYGTTYKGGTMGRGAVYKIDPAGRETLLHSFTGGSGGCYPDAGVTGDAAGNLYGTTKECGSLGLQFGHGIVYKLDPSGNLTVLHDFGNGVDGGYPVAGVVLDSAGNLYGAASVGSANNGGAVYKVDRAGNYSVLYSFTPGSGWSEPEGTPALDSAGNLYGTSVYGGVFKIDPAGNFTPIQNFSGAGGSDLLAGVVLDAAGNIYGTAYKGGSCSLYPAGCGVVFKLDPSGNETVLYTFTGGADGSSPFGGVVLDAAGNLYGTAEFGGSAPGGAGNGVVFKLDRKGNETVVHTFTDAPDGSVPEAGVILDPAGNIYGTTYSGGKQDYGVVFKLTPQ